MNNQLRNKITRIKLLDSDGNTISFETQLAIVSHYLQNKKTKYEATYKNDAQKIIQRWKKLINIK